MIDNLTRQQAEQDGDHDHGDPPPDQIVGLLASGCSQDVLNDWEQEENL